MTAFLPLLLVAAVQAAAPSVELQARATGHFVLAEPREVYVPRLEAAVEDGMASLPFFIKPLAKLRLRPAVFNTVCESVDLALTAERFDISCGGELAPFSRALDNSDGPIIDDGDPYDVRVEHGENWVSIRFSGEMGGRASRYELEPDGGMVIHTVIFSGYLPDELSWSLRYRRAD